MSNIYLTSDLHLGHEFVARLRGFDDVNDHDAAIIENLASTLRKNDTLYVLGDLVGRSSEWKYALRLMDTLPGSKRLVSGNHDPSHPMSKSHGKRTREALMVFDSVAPFGQIKIGEGHRAMLSHFPYCTDRNEVRYMEWRLRDEGLPLFHGHVHYDSYAFASDREIHVGVDAWGLHPVSLHEAMSLLPRPF